MRSATSSAGVQSFPVWTRREPAVGVDDGGDQVVGDVGAGLGVALDVDARTGEKRATSFGSPVANVQTPGRLRAAGVRFSTAGVSNSGSSVIVTSRTSRQPGVP